MCAYPIGWNISQLYPLYSLIYNYKLSPKVSLHFCRIMKEHRGQANRSSCSETMQLSLCDISAHSRLCLMLHHSKHSQILLNEVSMARRGYEATLDLSYGKFTTQSNKDAQQDALNSNQGLLFCDKPQLLRAVYGNMPCLH